MSDNTVVNWSEKDVIEWLKYKKLADELLLLFRNHQIDGKTLLCLNDYDFRSSPFSDLRVSTRKKLQLNVKCLQRENHASLVALGIIEPNCIGVNSIGLTYDSHRLSHEESESYPDSERISPPVSIDGRSTELKPEIWKAGLSIAYAFLVMWLTSLVMVLVHDRVPDMKIYPPLPDIVLDNVPHIPLAFALCELLGAILAVIWLFVLLLHRHRMILLRRFFALAGTVFLLRCVTMLITSLSVPGTHLKCQPRDPKENTAYGFYDELLDKMSRAFVIWRGGGLSIRGVRTCGDYMFSGHTVALTLLNFFITEYTNSNYLHIVTWIMNLFGIFFILAAHEHYSIDVFIAFYITSRLFLYYHTLANNQALMQRDSNRTRIWFPLFSYFESSVDGIVPNEYTSIYEMITDFYYWYVEKQFLCIVNIKRIFRTIMIHSQTPTDRSVTTEDVNQINVSTKKTL